MLETVKTEPQLTYRKVNKEEVAKRKSPGTKAVKVKEIAQQFIDPDTGQSIEVGEAVEVGPFVSEAKGTAWISYYMPDVYRELKWHEKKTSKNQRVYTADPQRKDDGFYFLIIRLI